MSEHRHNAAQEHACEQKIDRIDDRNNVLSIADAAAESFLLKTSDCTPRIRMSEHQRNAGHKQSHAKRGGHKNRNNSVLLIACAALEPESR